MIVVCAAAELRVNALVRAAGLISAGAIVAPFLTIIWLCLEGSAGDAWVAVIDYNRVYVSAGLGSSLVGFVDAFAHDVWRRTKTDPLWMSGMLSAAWCVQTWWTRSADSLSRLLPWWLGLSLIAAMGGGVRLYNAYFIPCLPPLALLTAWAMSRAWRSHALLNHLVAALLLLAALAVAVRANTFGQVWTTERADLTHERDPTAYLERFGGYGNGRGYSAKANQELVHWLRANSAPDDRVFIFGFSANVYFEARRLPAHRFLWVGPAVEGLLQRQEFTLERLAADLAASRVRFIVREANNGDSLLGWRSQLEFAKPPMQHLLASYDEVARMEDFTIYRRRTAPE